MKFHNTFLIAIAIILNFNNSLAQSSEKLLRQAEKARINSDYQKAHDLLTQAIEIDPDNWKAYKERSEVYLLLAKPDSSLLDKYNYAKISGGSKRLWYDLFHEFSKKQDIIRFEDCALQFYRFDSSALGDNMIGLAYYSMGDYFTGIYYFQKAINKEDSSYVYYFNLAQCYYALNSLDDAKIYYNISKNLNPYTGTVYIGLGAVDFQNGSYETAIEYLDKGLLFSDADRSKALLYRGLSYIQLEMISQGCSDLKEAGNQGNIQAIDSYEIYCR